MPDADRRYACGVDEAGRGCLAGPLCAAAVILDPGAPIDGLADSKRLSPETRKRLEEAIKARAFAWGIGWASVREIDRRGIEWANRIAFTRSVRDLLKRMPAGERKAVAERMVVQIDGNRRALRLGLEQQLIKGGDASVPAISAASILAKTARDRYVLETLHPSYPHFGFDAHKGYATRRHLEALAAWGPTIHHRISFRRRDGETLETRGMS